MSAPNSEQQATDFEAVTKEMENEGTPFSGSGSTEQDPASESEPTSPAEPATEPAAEPAAEPVVEPVADPPAPEEPEPVVISEEAQKQIDAANARAAAADRAANLERRQREDLAARQAGIQDREQRMAYSARLQEALNDPEKADALIQEQLATATASAPVPENVELGIRANERQRFGPQLMEKLRENLNLTGLTEAQSQEAYDKAKLASGKDTPFAQDVLSAEVEIVSGVTTSTVTDQATRIKELEAQIVADGGEVAGARLRSGGPETPSEPVSGGRNFTDQQIDNMTEAQWDRNEDSILASEAARLKRLKAAEQ